jgi:hypothetical protein
MVQYSDLTKSPVFCIFVQKKRPDSKMCEDSSNDEEEAAPDLLVHKHRQPSQVTLGLKILSHSFRSIHTIGMIIFCY